MKNPQNKPLKSFRSLHLAEFGEARQYGKTHSAIQIERCHKPRVWKVIAFCQRARVQIQQPELGF
jgi:hypothetical protein